MPKTLHLPSQSRISTPSGIAITWTKTASRLDIAGWYDFYDGILEEESFTLRQFFDELGITEKDYRKAWRE